MIYSNLIFFLVAIVLFSTSEASTIPLFAGPLAFVFYLVSLGGFYLLVRQLFKRVGAASSRYFKAEKQATILALLSFGLLIYGLDIKSYLEFLSFGDMLPSVVNAVGILIFFSYFAVIWLVARPSYLLVFGRSYSPRIFVWTNFKSNLPIILPWLILSIAYDVLLLLPFESLNTVIETVWGDLLFFVLFLMAVMLLFPPLVRRLWGCEKLPEGQLRDELEEFCRKQNFTAELYLWPLFEGRVLTAGVMGFMPGLRYILLTPAIIESMTKDELEAVMGHEIGHVKRYHLLLYVFLIAGFSVFMGFLIEPALRVLFSFSFLINFMVEQGITPEQMFTYTGTGALLVFLIIYFRFIFGYFIRNFERQADTYVFTAIGTGKTLISAFERLALLSGDIRDKPNWHHFGIGERVDYLERCEDDPSFIKKQDSKVRWSLISYGVILLLTGVLVGKFPTETYVEQYKEKYTEAYLVDKVKNGSDDYQLLQLAGDFMLFKQREGEAVEAYEMAVALKDDEPPLLNNLAWLLLTSKDHALRNPIRALRLARTAADILPKGYILDTLATAYWANGFVEKALATEAQAIFVDNSKRALYLEQANKFRSYTYEKSLELEKQQLE